MAAADNNESRDRRAKLLDSAATMNGIDYVEITSPDQRSLCVHFLNTIEVKADVSQVTITGGDVIRRVTVNPIKESDWKLESDHRALKLTVEAPGDFSFYTLKLVYKPDSLVIDPFFDHVTFSFKALCLSDLDCASPPPACPPPSGDRPPIDYLAKDFLSFRKALSDFSALRYPHWVERAEADFGVMFMEALCSLADDLSYLQDRVAAEAALDTATRAVRPEDYRAAAEILPWVRRAGTTFRWTGSWLTVFTTPDPKESEELPLSEHKQLVDLLNRYRLAGYESYVLAPRYVALDLKITVCARQDVFQSDVKEALLAALGNSRLSDGTTSFFHPDRFTFGTPLERSALEATIQAVYGVAGVLVIEYRRRGLIINYRDMPDPITVAPDEIIQLDNNPNHPERGSLKISVRGGK